MSSGLYSPAKRERERERAEKGQKGKDSANHEKGAEKPINNTPALQTSVWLELLPDLCVCVDINIVVLYRLYYRDDVLFICGPASICNVPHFIL